jgi:hypothetical protein
MGFVMRVDDPLIALPAEHPPGIDGSGVDGQDVLR